MFDTKDHKIIAALSSTDSYLSGNQLGDLLGMSRVAIGKRLRVMQAAGLPVETKAATGYRLQKGFTPLNQNSILQLLNQSTISKLAKSEVHIVMDSTNSQIESIFLNAGQTGFVTTEVQNLGKGRRSNNWISTPFQNIMLSLAWQFPVWPTDITAFSLATGVMVADVLGNLGIKGLQLKWPNDLYLNGAKIGGILINIKGDSGAEVRLNCGIGLNIKISAKDQQAIDQECTDLYTAGHKNLNRNYLIADLVNNWVDLCEQFQSYGFAPYSERWHSLHLFQNCDVIATKGKLQVVGRVTGVDAQGSLVIKKSNLEEARIVDPEYSLRLV